MAGRTHVGESENAKVKYRFHEVSRSIKLAAPWQEAALKPDTRLRGRSRYGAAKARNLNVLTSTKHLSSLRGSYDQRL
jgi:hypothetical protein